jgi:hypothetical protein
VVLAGILDTDTVYKDDTPIETQYTVNIKRVFKVRTTALYLGCVVIVFNATFNNISVISWRSVPYIKMFQKDICLKIVDLNGVPF